MNLAHGATVLHGNDWATFGAGVAAALILGMLWYVTGKVRD